MKNWITVTVPDGGKDVKTLINIRNITHIKNLDDFMTPSVTGKARIYLNTSTDVTQRYLPCHEDFATIMALITAAQ